MAGSRGKVSSCLTSCGSANRTKSESSPTAQSPQCRRRMLSGDYWTWLVGNPEVIGATPRCATVSTGEKSRFHSSYKRGCQEKNSSPLPSGDLLVALHPAPSPSWRGFWFLPLWIAAYCSGDANPSCWFPGNGFISPWALEADPLRSYVSPCVGF